MENYDNYEVLFEMLENLYQSNLIYKSFYNNAVKVIRKNEALRTINQTLKSYKATKTIFKKYSYIILFHYLFRLQKIKTLNQLLTLLQNYMNGLLKKNRVFMNDAIIIQNAIYNEKHSNLQKTFLAEYTNKNINEILNNTYKILKRNNKFIKRMNIQIMYNGFDIDFSDEIGDEVAVLQRNSIRHSTRRYRNGEVVEGNPEFTAKTTSSDFFIHRPTSVFNYYFVGYRAFVFETTPIMEFGEIHKLKAFSPSENRKFHEMTTASTSNNKLCIYETFLDVCGIMSIINVRKNKKEELKKKFEEESEEIKENLKKGLLVVSLEQLTKKYEKTVHIVFYGSKYHLEEGEIVGDKPIIKISNGETTILKNDDIKKLSGNKIFLYDEGRHVAPSKFNFIDIKTIEQKERKKENYQLRPEYLKNTGKELDGVLAFDFETFSNIKRYAVPYCICVYGVLRGEDVKKTFYGLECVKKFCDYIESITTKINNSRTKEKVPVPYIHFYSFNGSRFDNIFIFRQLYKLNKDTSFVFTKNSIKTIRYNNIKIIDIACIFNYKGLRNTAKEFGLEEEKGVFPYNAINADNIYDEINIINPKIWRNEGEMKEYIIKELSETMNVKKYTKKYCLLDCKLTYEIASIFLKMSKGVVECDKPIIKNTHKKLNKKTKNEKQDPENIRYYNLSKVSTSAKMAVTMFKQTGLENPIKQSPDRIVKIERSSYIGGRTEVFISRLEDGKVLYKYDINSSYPASMCGKMPSEYITTVCYDKEEKKVYEDIKECNLYNARVQYDGGDPNFIPNILIRTEKGNIIATKNTPFFPIWGCELKEAIKNNCSVYVLDEHIYKEEYIFKVFIENIYKLRLEAKKENNKVMILFYKNIMNSLYGKFGQKVFNKTAICENMNDIYKLLKNDMFNMVDVEILNDDLMLLEYKEDEQEYTSIGKLVRLSSFIASKSRCNLSAGMRNVGHKNVYYCDTDSIFTSVKLSDEFISETELGKYKLEDTCTKAIFIAKKVYYLKTLKNKEIKKVKGFKNKSLTFEDYNGLNIDEITELRQKSLMFYRTFNNIRIEEEQERTLKKVLTSRKFNNKGSSPFNNIEEFEKTQDTKTYKKEFYNMNNDFNKIFKN